MAKNNPQHGKEVLEGVLRGHFRTGKTYKTPMTALPGMTLSEWVTSDLPDLLWPLVLVARAGDRGSYVMSQAQQSVISAIAPHEPKEAGVALDGRLTSLESVTTHRLAITAALHSHPLAAELFEPGVLGVLRLYGDALPGRWLFDNAPGVDDALAFEDAVHVLADSMVAVAGDRHLNALVKAAPFGWMLQTGRLSMPVGLGEELIAYPTVKENIAKADAFILSSFLATKSFPSEEVQAGRSSWSAAFWNANWRMTACVPEEEVSAEVGDHEDDVDASAEFGGRSPSNTSSGEGNGGDDELPGEGLGSDEDDSDPRTEPVASALKIYDSFLADVLDPGTPVDLNAPARFEVLTGFVARAMRSVVAILRAPHLWSGEQAAPVMRALIESRIVGEWLLAQDEDWFARYQYYGRGKRKLHREVVNEFLSRMGEDAPPELTALLEELDELTGHEYGSMFQDVSIDSTFAGKTLRSMAEEVDLSDEYRFNFQIESGVTHGEWWAIEEFAMQRCLNPLHRFHLLPTFNPMYPPTRSFPSALLSRFRLLVETARAGILGLEDDTSPPEV